MCDERAMRIWRDCREQAAVLVSKSSARVAMHAMCEMLAKSVTFTQLTCSE